MDSMRVFAGFLGASGTLVSIILFYLVGSACENVTTCGKINNVSQSFHNTTTITTFYDGPATRQLKEFYCGAPTYMQQTLTRLLLLGILPLLINPVIMSTVGSCIRHSRDPCIEPRSFNPLLFLVAMAVTWAYTAGLLFGTCNAVPPAIAGFGVLFFAFGQSMFGMIECMGDTNPDRVCCAGNPQTEHFTMSPDETILPVAKLIVIEDEN